RRAPAKVERPRTGSLQRRMKLQAHRMIELLREIQLPIVCGVRGWAAGLGFQLALAADFTIAAEAASWGLIHRAVPDGEVESAASALVEQLGRGPTVALGLTKHSIHRSLET